VNDTSKHVLIADDDDIDIEVLRPVIESYNAIVSSVDSVDQAKRFLDRASDTGEAIALVLLDWKLSGLGKGEAVLRTARESNFHEAMPVVVISKSLAPGDVRDATRAGANACVAKTLILEDYEAKIDATCRFWLLVAESPATPLEATS
jgi:CheY-like chemotaxis protein